ncbi:zinc ribbon domain-containing protein [Limnoraphis robusta]|uniref:zinc ribbon domain-containing protein n=1 Tax=Limnoraphis robusta TaxID=1118279 RepID=UPI0009E436A7|nr:zinc ribbon domain-containing protein [Limnoraphis robusta]
MRYRFYPSTKTCSSCGHVQQIALKERVFNCQACGVSVDRDLNASLNLEGYAEGFLVKSLSDRGKPTVRGDAGTKH